MHNRQELSELDVKVIFMFINLSTLCIAVLKLTRLYLFDQYTKLIMLVEERPSNKALKTLNLIKKEIDGMINNPDQKTLLDILQKITEQVKQDHLGIIIALDKDEQLLKFIKAVRTFHSQKRRESIEKHIAILYLCAYQSYFMHNPKYVETFSYFVGKIHNLINNKSFKQHTQNYQNYQSLRLLLNKLFEITKTQSTQYFQKAEILNKYVQQILRENQPKTLFEECVFTFIRRQLEKTQGENLKNIAKQQILGFCCNLHFEHRGSKNHVETQSQNFSKQFQIKNSIPKQNVNKQIQTIKKQVISYLNSTSGIYYLGIDYSIKQAKFIGISLDEQKKKQLVAILFSQLVMKIFPSDGENEEEDQKIEESRLNKLQIDKKNEIANSKQGFNYEYILNSYISVDFINLYDKDTWFYARNDQVPLFIARIKVRLGSEYEVYHHINNKQIPQAFLREDKKEKKLTMIEYYDEVYRRLKNKANNKVTQNFKPHALCRAFENTKQMI